MTHKHQPLSSIVFKSINEASFSVQPLSVPTLKPVWLVCAVGWRYEDAAPPRQPPPSTLHHPPDLITSHPLSDGTTAEPWNHVLMNVNSFKTKEVTCWVSGPPGPFQGHMGGVEPITAVPGRRAVLQSLAFRIRLLFKATFKSLRMWASNPQLSARQVC